MAKRSDQNNPEQKTQNGHNPEFSNELDPAVQVKQRNSKKGQPQKSKQSE
ncbi:glycogen biosynthesis protein GlgD [Bacillus pacificus]